MSPPRMVTLAQVLARIEAAELPDVEVLAELPADELERQLAALGVDVDSEMGELLSAVGGEPALVPLEQLAASDLAALSLDEVEARLRRDGVDVAGYLARALTLIRSPPAVDLDRSDSRRHRAAPHDARTRRERRRRGLPRAVAASVIAVSIGGVVFTLVHQHGTLSTPVAEQRGFGADAPGVAASLDESIAEVAQIGEADRQAPGGGSRRHADVDGDRHESLEPTVGTTADKPLARADDGARPAAEALTTAAKAVAAESRSVLAPAAAPRAPASSNAAPAVRALQIDPLARSAARSRLSDGEARSSAPDPVATAAAPAAARARSARRAEESREVTPRAGVGAGRIGSGVGSAAAADTTVQRSLAVGAGPQQGELVSVTLAPGETLAQALARLTLAGQDRDALVALLSEDAAVVAGRLRLMLDGERVLSAELERGGSDVVRVRRSPSGALQRSP